MWCICKTIEFFKGLPESFLDQSVHLDELSYQTKYKKPNPLRQPLLEQIKGARLDEIKHVDHHLGDKKANLRIKIKMTKEEAGRLLGKCRDEKGRLEFRDVALELAKIPPHRILEVSTIQSSTT